MTEELMIPDTPQVGESESENELLQWYITTLTDFIFKLSLATVLFFMTYPWAALFWPPYYLTARWKE